MQFSSRGLCSALMADLFADQELPSRAEEALAAGAPLADQLRPKSLDEVVG